MISKGGAVIAVAALLAVAGTGCGRQKAQVVARVNQQPITQRQLWEALEKADGGEQGRRALDGLIVRQLVRQEAEKRGVKVTREELERRIEWLKHYILAQTGKDFATWLADTGQSEEDMASQLSREILTAKLVLSENEKEKYFEEQKEQLKELPHNNEAVIYRQIVVASKAEAEAIRKELTSDAPDFPGIFVQIAEERSLDPMTRSRGGMVGWMVKGKSMDGELEKTLFALKPGEISEPLAFRAPGPPTSETEQEAAKGPEMWRIVRVEEHIPAPQEITLANNETVVEEWMLSDPQFQPALIQFFESLRARANVEIVDTRYRAVGEAYRERQKAREQQVAPIPMAPVGPETPHSSSPEEGGAEAEAAGK
jgi:parvulin-like peptidyl-prolyl isomerase